jgi:hypothetical protein
MPDPADRVRTANDAALDASRGRWRIEADNTGAHLSKWRPSGRSTSVTGVAASDVEQSLTIGPPASQPRIHHGTGTLKPPTAVSEVRKYVMSRLACGPGVG